MGVKCVEPVGSTSAAIIGLYGGIRCGRLAGYDRSQMRKMFEMVFDEYESSKGVEDAQRHTSRSEFNRTD